MPVRINLDNGHKVECKREITLYVGRRIGIQCIMVYITYRPHQEISLWGRVIYKAFSEVESIKVSFLCC